MRKYVIAILFLFTCISVVEAQRWRLQRYRVFFGAGFSNYFGDIGGTAADNNYLGFADVGINTTYSSFHFGALYKLQQNLDVKLNVNHAILRGSDLGSRNEIRNLSFNSTLWEVSGQVNYIFYSGLSSGGGLFSRRGLRGSQPHLNMHVFVGLGGAHYDASLGSEQAVQERLAIGHPGEMDKQTGLTAVIPAGVGLSYLLGNFWELGFELGGRYTFTNSLDGFASHYGTRNDIYYFSTLQLIYRMRSDRRGRPQLELFRKY